MVTMDFISDWPTLERCESVIGVVDKFSKYATFMASLADCTAEQITKLLFKHVMEYWGLPQHIVSDWTQGSLESCGLNFSRSWGLNYTSRQAFIHKLMDKQRILTGK